MADAQIREHPGPGTCGSCNGWGFTEAVSRWGPPVVRIRCKTCAGTGGGKRAS